MIRIEHNVETGEILEIELTADEIKDLEVRQKEAKVRIEKLEAEAAIVNAEKDALLKKLGITKEEAALLLG